MEGGIASSCEDSLINDAVEGCKVYIMYLQLKSKLEASTAVRNEVRSTCTAVHVLVVYA